MEIASGVHLWRLRTEYTASVHYLIRGWNFQLKHALLLSTYETNKFMIHQVAPSISNYNKKYDWRRLIPRSKIFLLFPRAESVNKIGMLLILAKNVCLGNTNAKIQVGLINVVLF